jgi:putative acetyltransferase
MDITIRQETPNDYRTVEELTREAFWNIYIPGCYEHLLLHNVRNSPDFIPELDLVAERDGRIIGHIVYTRAVIKNDKGREKKVICFGPVSVLPSLQKQHIGSALIEHSLAIARKMGFPSVLIYGDPRYYSRFGFRCAEKYDIKTFDGKYAIALLALELKPGALKKTPGRFIESPDFEVDEGKLAEFDATFPPRDKAYQASQDVFKVMAALRY